jgi:GT2 family glycosyltransferase
MIEPDTVTKLGYFCEDYKPAFFEDNDMHWRILLMGYKAFTTDMAPYSHIASRTRYENPTLVDHYKFRQSKINFFRNMHTVSVEQSIADERYKYWMSKNPGIKHPRHTQVLELCINDGIIDQKMISQIEAMTIHNID